jgi:transposase
MISVEWLRATFPRATALIEPHIHVLRNAVSFALIGVVNVPVPTGVRVWLATGHTGMRKGFANLSLQVQEVLQRDPLCGHLFCFRRRCGNL